MQPKYQVQLKIRRSAAAVFEAVVRPEKLSSYFVQSASAPLTEGTTVKWKFAEVPGEHDVTVRRVVKDQCVVLEWAGTQSGQKIRVEMMFQALDADTTMVQISEFGWQDTPADLASSHGNAGGWMHMMCCLKAYLEYGINLRAGGAR